MWVRIYLDVLYKCISFPRASIFNAYINHIAKPYAWCNRIRSHAIFPWCQSFELCKWKHEAEACHLFNMHYHVAWCIVKWGYLSPYLHFSKVHISAVSMHSGSKFLHLVNKPSKQKFIYIWHLLSFCEFPWITNARWPLIISVFP